jgi:aryl-alcohol dehydrogenase-like predicted oxidoreductase
MEISQALGKTPAQVALNWLLQQPGVTAPIMGARKLAQLEDNLGGVGWALSADELDRLNNASQIPLPSPYNFIAKYTRRRDPV